MVFLEFLTQLFTGILIGYLALTNTLAHNIETLIGSPRKEISHEIQVEDSTPKDTNSSNLATIPSHYVTGGPIPKILLENSNYQQAALGAGAFAEEDGTKAETPVVTRIEESLVNIFCQYKTDEYIRTTAGTGFFIHPGGVVLTNAHVAQFLLLENTHTNIKDAECILRGGNPARPLYTVELLYISPAWVFENAKLVNDETPRGTGERDYALLYVSDTLDGTPLPSTFPSLSVDTELLSRYTKDTRVLSAGYPAEALYSEGANVDLRPLVATSTVRELYTFGSNYADIFSVSSSSVGEQGSSGGPVARTDGRVIGLIVTKGSIETEGVRSLRALTLSYIDRTITEETGFSLYQNMQGNLGYRSNIFKQALVPFLYKLLSLEIDPTSTYTIGGEANTN